MKSRSESISTKSDNSTMVLPRGFHQASSSAVAPGMLSVITKETATAARKISAFSGSRL